MKLVDIIKQKLTESLEPENIEVEDESHKHIGHVGSKPGGETHFFVKIVSQKFDGISRIARQRMVFEILGEEMKGKIHAISIKAISPKETG